MQKYANKNVGLELEQKTAIILFSKNDDVDDDDEM